MIGGRRGVRRTCARPLRPARPAAGPACRRMPGSCPSSYSSPSTSPSSVLRPSQSPVLRPHAARVRVRSVRFGRDREMPRHALKRRGGQSRGRERRTCDRGGIKKKPVSPRAPHCRRAGPVPGVGGGKAPCRVLALLQTAARQPAVARREARRAWRGNNLDRGHAGFPDASLSGGRLP